MGLPGMAYHGRQVVAPAILPLAPPPPLGWGLRESSVGVVVGISQRPSSSPLSRSLSTHVAFLSLVFSVFPLWRRREGKGQPADREITQR